MSKKEGVAELTVREQRAKQLKNQKNTNNEKNALTETNKLYKIINEENMLRNKEKERKKLEKKEKEDEPKAKPIRNIFKMSRVLVTAKDKLKKGVKSSSSEDPLKK
jgi:hypothetical protein